MIRLPHRLRLVLPAFLLVCLGPAGARAQAPADTAAGDAAAVSNRRDPRAVELAHTMMKAMGGEANYRAQRMLTFTFQVVQDGKPVLSRTHHWDRWTGRYRLESTTREGKQVVALFNVNTREGRIWLDGEEQTGEARDQNLERAYAQYINDSYWLLNPWKWLDPGVNLAWEGRKEANGKGFDVVELSFGDVGLTSNDRYWSYVSPATHLIERWEYVLQKADGSPGDAPPTAFDWKDWHDVGGGVLLSTRRVQEGASRSIEFPLCTLSATVDESAFLPPGGN